jgi:hypothetical protein
VSAYAAKAIGGAYVERTSGAWIQRTLPPERTLQFGMGTHARAYKQTRIHGRAHVMQLHAYNCVYGYAYVHVIFTNKAPLFKLKPGLNSLILNIKIQLDNYTLKMRFSPSF